MDNDRYRSTDRRVVNGSSAERSSSSQPAERRQPEEVIYAQPEKPDNTQINTPAAKPKKSAGPWIIVIVLAIVLAGTIAWFTLSKKGSDTGINTSKYQAVFLSNGQHYFGKLSSMGDEYFKLSDVYYLEQKGQADTAVDTTKSGQTPVELRKLGEKEIHGPENTMMISKQQVLLYENLSDDSQVVKSIDQHRQQAK